MKYRVVFMERTDAQGRKTENSPGFAELDLTEGVVLDRVILEPSNPTSVHSEEVMSEDDSFLSVGTEVWEYDIAEAVKRSLSTLSGTLARMLICGGGMHF